VDPDLTLRADKDIPNTTNSKARDLVQELVLVSNSNLLSTVMGKETLLVINKLLTLGELDVSMVLAIIMVSDQDLLKARLALIRPQEVIDLPGVIGTRS